MPEDENQQVERANRIAAITVAISGVTKALIEVKRDIRMYVAHPLVGALSATKVELGAQLLNLNNEFEDILAGNAGTIKSPTARELEEISALARRVDDLILGARTADALLQVANSGLALAGRVMKAA